jgi:hypothetical protein
MRLMSAAALKTLASVGATTLYDAIGRAETSAELDGLWQQVSRGWGDSAILDDDASCLFEYIHRRRPVQRAQGRQQTLPGLPLPEPNSQRVGRYPRRRVQRSPDKQASYDRRHRLAYSGVMPPDLAARLTIGDMAVMSVVAAEYRRIARCELTLDEIAARAGVCRRTARRAMHEARDQHLISIEERPIRGKKHRPNLVKITSFEWLKWLRRPKDNQQKSTEPIGGHSVAPTNNNLTDDSAPGGKNTAVPPTMAPPRSGQPSKEAIEFSAELANISGYRQANVPKSWRDANPPQIVQVWLNELAGKDRRPADALRALAMKVIRRKRALSDASAPYSPRYFSAEVKKLIQSRSELQPTRDRPQACCVGQ